MAASLWPPKIRSSKADGYLARLMVDGIIRLLLRQIPISNDIFLRICRVLRHSMLWV